MAGWDFTQATIVSSPVYSCSMYVIILSPYSMTYITAADIPYILESNPHPVFGDFLNGKKKS
jgi:hypothetical protein